jgi:hypothetical protein
VTSVLKFLGRSGADLRRDPEPVADHKDWRNPGYADASNFLGAGSKDLFASIGE